MIRYDSSLSVGLITLIHRRLRVSMPATIAKKLKDSVIALTASVESEDWDNQGDFELVWTNYSKV